MSESTLKSYQFRKEREATWLELDRLITRIEKRGLPDLTAEEVMRLPMLYRAALSSLSVARSISLDRNLVGYLESLAGRAYFNVYATRTSFLDAVVAFFVVEFPAAVRSARWHMVIAGLAMICGTLTGHFLVLSDLDIYYSFMPEAMAQGRDPSASTEDLRNHLYDAERPADATLMTFATYLFTHNSMVAIFAFALGFALGVPTLLLMFYNGLILGAFTALHSARGLSYDVWGWLMIHGSTELMAVILCGGAGLVLGSSIIFPGSHSRIDNLSRNGRKAGTIVLGGIFMLLFAGLLEGIGRQTITDPTARYAIAVFMAAFWICYFAFSGRRRS